MLQLFIAIIFLLFLGLFVMLSMPISPEEDETSTKHALAETHPPQS